MDPTLKNMDINTNATNRTNTKINFINISSKNQNQCEEQQKGLETEYDGQCDNELDSKQCNQFLLKRELADRICLNDLEQNESYEREGENASFLYPEFNDTQFNVKIAEKKEFQETKYDGEIHPDIKEYADQMSNADFEIQPHQAFVRNFLSFQTPYNSLLLYHGLGSGKTYSAIGVTEEMREYLKNLGSNKKIIVVASENVQNNFRMQMFDDRKLVLVNDRWTIKGYVANQLLKEVNPMNHPGIPKEKIVSQVKALIKHSYLFLGYGQFANYIINTMNRDERVGETRNHSNLLKTFRIEDAQSNRSNPFISAPFRGRLNENWFKPGELDKAAKLRLKNEFEGRLIVIDEIHNIRKAEDAESKKVAANFEILVTAVRNLRLLFLSATPMFNSYKEIVWLMNIMNMNDRRAKIEVKDVFEADGEFKKEGRELLIRKLTGYVSFVRGENPYTFPYRVYPSLFAPKSTFPEVAYPLYQMNGKRIPDDNRERILSLYLTKIGGCGGCGACQYCDYRYILYYLKNKNMNVTTKKGRVREMRSFLDMAKFGYTLLQTPLESLIISYPNEKLKEIIGQIPENQYTEELAENIAELAEAEDLVTESTVINLPTLHEKEEEVVVIKGGQGAEGTEGTQGTRGTRGTEGTETNQTSLRIDPGLTIDPRDLTGKRGLERMMDFVDKTTIPPEKGAFEYKKSTLDNYGRLFSPPVIGKYSAKIKNVLESIRYSLSNDSLTNDFGVAEGVILIYSQYIDAGLIPMALALEEMGFTRYGKDVKPLFKTAPTEVVDVRTLKPPASRNDFLPARYAMITGDLRLSPDNEFEVKGLTNDDNKDGKKVKVVLISRTGAEGIDFKYIRQIHILEPWYNMNRMEQIIGRGVRNSSHKAIPFEKRNVEIFMYGTILEENQEEAADLYVYRVAEYKAKQIGRVTRLMKETAVDCIVHHDQTNFTQEKMAEIMKKPVTQILSNGLVIKDFKVGDLPYSPACDYMATCNYQCIPDIGDSNTLKTDESTYGEAFMNMNNDKIIQKVKMLMRERFFYVKKELIAFIQVPKAYSLIQIYSALTQMIEENEVIQDRYDRTGYLVNIGEYYLFQPLELTDKHISVFDRSVPIDYKHQMIRFDLKAEGERKGEAEGEPEKVQGQVEQEAEDSDMEESVIEIKERKTVLNEVRERFDYVQSILKGQGEGGEILFLKDDNGWYKRAGKMMKDLNRDFQIPWEELNEYLVDHIIETLLIPQRVELLNMIYLLHLWTIKSPTSRRLISHKGNGYQATILRYKIAEGINNVERNSLEWYVKKYFMRNVISLDDFDAIVFLGPVVFVLNPKTNQWTPAEPEDLRDLENSAEGKAKLHPTFENKKKYIGFIGYEKKNQSLVFKTRDLSAKRDLGARCDQAKKSKTVDTLNFILGEERFTVENTKDVYQKEDLCILLEFLMRNRGQMV